MPKNPNNIGSNTSYRMGMMSGEGTAEFAELSNQESFTGSSAIRAAKANGKKMITWDDFFEVNPFNLKVGKMWYIYEIGQNGNNDKYVKEGKFKPVVAVNNGLGDGMQQPQSNRNAYNAAKTELENALQKIVELQDKNAELESINYTLKQEQEKFYKEEKIPLETKIVGLEYQIKAMEKEKEAATQTLRDDFARETRDNQEKLEKIELQNRIKRLEEDKTAKSSALSGMFNDIAPLAVPAIGEALMIGAMKLNEKYPHLFGRFAQALGGNTEPSPEHAAELAQKQVQPNPKELNTKTAFQANM